jgi:glycosyltransferase involved in cell wall biosynthesis
MLRLTSAPLEPLSPSATAPADRRANGGSTPGRQPRRILYVESNIDGTVGGSHRALYDVVRNLDRSRFEPIVLFYQENAYVERLRTDGVQVLVIERETTREKAALSSGRRIAQGAMLLESIVRRIRLLKRERIGILHLNNGPFVGLDDWLPAARIAGVPCVTSVMGDQGHSIHPLRTWMLRQYDAILPCSKFIEGTVMRHGVRADRVELTYLGIDPEGLRARIRHSREAVRHSLGIANDAVLIAMVGNVRPWKGQHVAIEAVAAMSSAIRSRIRLLIIGTISDTDEDRVYKARLQARIESAGLEDTVLFLGHRDDVPDLVNAADIALHASVRPEPFGLVVTEAMALGKAVVAANTGGPAEVLVDGSGVTFDPNDPKQLAQVLGELVADEQRRHALGERALRRVADFTIEQTMARTIGVYDRVLGAPARSHEP